jgi:hypothetical protein
MVRAYRDRLRLARSKGRWLVAYVHGDSMLPTLRDGDALLVDRRCAVQPGCLAVLDLPDGTTAVKRVAHRDRRGWWVERDNPRVGVDSWSVGAVADRDVHGVVRVRLWPRPGRLGRPAPMTA